jgi:dsRNA-specific ribonuclease
MSDTEECKEQEMIHAPFKRTLAPGTDILIANPKGFLNEYCQKKYHAYPTYHVVVRIGPRHFPMFTIQVNIPQQNSTGIGKGRTKKAAEEAAALDVIKQVYPMDSIVLPPLRLDSGGETVDSSEG